MSTTFTEPFAALRALLKDDDRATTTVEALPAMLDVCEALRAFGVARAAKQETKAAVDKAMRAFYDAPDVAVRDAAHEEWGRAASAHSFANGTHTQASRRLAQLADLLVKTETCDKPSEGEVE